MLHAGVMVAGHGRIHRMERGKPESASACPDLILPIGWDIFGDQIMREIQVEALTFDEQFMIPVHQLAPRVHNRSDIRFIRLAEVMVICGKSRSSIYDAIKRGPSQYR